MLSMGWLNGKRVSGIEEVERGGVGRWDALQALRTLSITVPTSRGRAPLEADAKQLKYGVTSSTRSFALLPAIHRMFLFPNKLVCDWRGGALQSG